MPEEIEMSEPAKTAYPDSVFPFNREFFNSGHDFTYIGSGNLGGKANGLASIKHILANGIDASDFPGVAVNIPVTCVIATDLFDAFMESNGLYDIAYSERSDDYIAHVFQRGDLPVKLVGDLWALIGKVHTPLAIRSSSLLEDSLRQPFAGIYATKMIPNNQYDHEFRFRKLSEAIKYVYASTFFKDAKSYHKATGHDFRQEKMAVIIQEVVGMKHRLRFYPNLSGVARSHNFYAIGYARPDEGVVELALGLGKTIVDDGVSWAFSPATPHIGPPYKSIDTLLKATQTSFWSINMGTDIAYNPLRETEYLQKAGLAEAEMEKTLKFLVSTYDIHSDRVHPGLGPRGPRIVNFAPILLWEQIPLTRLLRKVLLLCRETLQSEVEIEFAMTYDLRNGLPARFGFLQLRPMMVFDEDVFLDDADLEGTDVLLASDTVLGHGTNEEIGDIVYVEPGKFNAKYSMQIAKELEEINEILTAENRPYLLIGFGRWGSTDPWLGIPTNWSQISGARVIVESTLPEMNVDLSQGSHFFHNITSLRISYFSLHHSSPFRIDWNWLNQQNAIFERIFVKAVNLSRKLTVKVDGRTGKGVILK